MKILLIEEYSSLHKNLKEGLEYLGHQVDIAATGDGWKNIPRNIDLNSHLISPLNKIQYRLNLLKLLKVAHKYDIIQLINPFIIPNNYFPFKYFYKELFKRNKNIFLLAAGDDAFFWKVARTKLRYGPFDDSLKYDLKKDNFDMNTNKAYLRNQYVAKNVKGIIPIMYEYQISYENHPNLCPTIPIPINIDKIDYQPNTINHRLVIFHGLNRYGFKGTRHVEQAFEYLNRKYPNDLELIIDGHLPLNQYLKIMRKTNIIIDQTNSYSLGVNGLYALAMGKIVLGGAEPESLAAFNIKKSPVLNITPDKNSIIQKIEYLLENKNKIKQLGEDSREYLENNHNYIKIAKQYLDTWASKI
ncbi:glycosyltransferase [Photorhabdus khanii]|uniref:Glycosyltransferase n=1 Tax=Photorhabdus khanii subsp. guanajuatensis TaxID=2100166 RepID=A0A4R4K0K4_9GAMM|nr:glycosyltransferase [Photorhabdus khanii]TDB60653.1 glycosyltransferase [Photorhabdus khanii subsp. guanajuatensis]